jgi:hypothetical protein
MIFLKKGDGGTGSEKLPVRSPTRKVTAKNLDKKLYWLP